MDLQPYTITCSTLEDRLPHLVAMEFDCSEPFLSEENNLLLLILINIAFSDTQWIRIPDKNGNYIAKFRVGLKEAILKLNIENGEIPIKHRGLIGEFEDSISFNIDSTDSDTNTGLSNVSLSLKNLREMGFSAERKKERLSQQKTSFSYEEFQVSTGGKANKPFWSFETKGRMVLKGTIQSKTLGVLHMKSIPCKLEAVLSTCVTDKNLVIIDFDTIAACSSIKKKVIKKFLSKNVSELFKFNPILSKVVVTCG